MKAVEFHQLFKTTGEKILAPLGFIYHAHAWHKSTDDIQLSFCPEDTRFGIGFAVKYLTLALWHKTVEVPASFSFKPLKNNTCICPVRISPALLCDFVENNFDTGLWDCSATTTSQDRLKTHPPVYFGGPDLWILADQTASPGENQNALLYALESDGITDLSESKAFGIVSLALSHVARYGIAWAEHMSVQETCRLMNLHAIAGTDHIFNPGFPCTERLWKKIRGQRDHQGLT